MDTFTRSYIQTILWAEMDHADEQGGEPLERNYGPEDFAPEALARIVSDCARFQERAGDLINEPDHRGDAGADFWFTRAGHGVGFWDGDWPENGERLTVLAKSFGEQWVTVGDDGRLYLDGGK